MASPLFSKPGKADRELGWAKIWFKKLAIFHGHTDRAAQRDWAFNADQVIEFLKSKRDAGFPAWKRLKIIRGLMIYRQLILQQSDEDLVPLLKKMEEIVVIERAQGAGYATIEEAAGKIDPNEPDAVQQFRIALRRDGMRLATERSYVGKLKAFMADRGLTCLADFASIGEADVEGHLTDLDFDNRRIEIHQSKGGKSRVVPMPEELVEGLERYLQSRRALHEHDLAEGTASVWLPHALAQKYPSAHREFRWQYLFASSRLSKDPRTGRLHRHHLHYETFPVHLRAAVERA